MDARKRDDTYPRGRGGHYIGHSPTAGTLGSCHSPGPLRSTLTSPAFLALSGRGYAELPLNGVLRSSHSPVSVQHPSEGAKRYFAPGGQRGGVALDMLPGLRA